MNLPQDMIIMIFGILSITGKRYLLQITTLFNTILRGHIVVEERKFINMINDTHFVSNNKLTFNRLHQYTLEFLYDGYIDIMPKKYIIKKNDMLFKYKDVYQNVSKNGNLTNVELLLSINREMDMYVMDGLA